MVKTSSFELPLQKFTFDRFGQIIFSIREVAKLALRAKSRLLIVLLILNAIYGFSAVPGFYISKLIIDRLVSAIGNPQWNEVILPIAILSGLGILLELLRSFLSRLTGFMERTMSRYFDSELNLLIAKKLTELDIATIESPEFRNKFTKIESESSKRAWDLMMPISDIPNYLVGFISSVVVLVIVNPFITIGVTIVSLPQLLINSRFIKKEYELHTELSPLRKTWGWLENYLLRNRNFLELKLLGISGYLSKKQRLVVNQVLDRMTEFYKKRETSRLGSLIPLSVFDLFVSVWLIYLVIIKKITIGSFQLYVSSLRSAQSNLTGLVSSIMEIYESYIYVADLVWLLKLEPKIEKTKEGGLIVDNITSLEFKNVSFRYKEDADWILKNVNFKINEGEKIALVGVNGSGKSTLIKLLSRFYDPQEGVVLVGDNDIKDIDIINLRRKLAVLFQMFELYPFSARDSIGYGDIERIGNFEDIRLAAEKTGIDEFIESLPLRWENPITPEFEKGVMPSIGQWQRFGISRMLFRKNAKVIILDEPTSSVDPEAEEKIFKELVKITKDKILIFVTQRFSTVRIADRIFVLDKGNLIEEGTHKELMKKKGKYFRLYSIQAEAYTENSKVKS